MESCSRYPDSLLIKEGCVVRRGICRPSCRNHIRGKYSARMAQRPRRVWTEARRNSPARAAGLQHHHCQTFATTWRTRSRTLCTSYSEPERHSDRVRHPMISLYDLQLISKGPTRSHISLQLCWEVAVSETQTFRRAIDTARGGGNSGTRVSTQSW